MCEKLKNYRYAQKFKPFMNSFLSEYTAAYTENHSTSHVLIRLNENWKATLDQKFLAGKFLMDSS